MFEFFNTIAVFFIDMFVTNAKRNEELKKEFKARFSSLNKHSTDAADLSTDYEDLKREKDDNSVTNS